MHICEDELEHPISNFKCIFVRNVKAENVKIGINLHVDSDLLVFEAKSWEYSAEDVCDWIDMDAFCFYYYTITCSLQFDKYNIESQLEITIPIFGQGARLERQLCARPLMDFELNYIDKIQGDK